MYALNNIVARSRNNCYRERATMLSLCTVKPHVDVNNTKILTTARQCSTTHVSPHQQYKVFRSSCKVADIFVRVESNFGFSRQVFIEVIITKFHQNPCSGSRADTSKRTEEGDKTNRSLHDYANALKKE